MILGSYHTEDEVIYQITTVQYERNLIGNLPF
jgi:hypothetical protein